MPVRVLKFGGTSVETPGHILAVARRILEARESGDSIVVVVSAMGQTTDELIRLAQRVSRTPPRRELDMLLTAGERISMTLLAMCLESLGCPAISFTGSQSGIVTDSRHTDARILSVRALRIEEELARGRVVIVAGFQGVSREKEVTTLGRGGSDTTAVALATRLGAKRCEIYTDVPGVLSADPRVVPQARRLPAVGYDAMIVLSHLGGRVLFRRAVLLARRYGVPIDVLSSFSREEGTRVDGDSAMRPSGPAAPGEAGVAHGAGPTEQGAAAVARGAGGGRAAVQAGSGPSPPSRRRPTEEEPMETDRVLGVALESPVYWVRILLPPEDPRVSAPTLEPELPAEGSPLLLHLTRVLMPDGCRVVEFAACPDPEVERWLEPARWSADATVEVERHAALLSVVGEGVLSEGGLIRRAAAALAEGSIPVWGIHTGTLSISFLVPEANGEAASRVLHRELVEKQ